MVNVTLESNLVVSSEVKNALTSVTQQIHLFTLEKLTCAETCLRIFLMTLFGLLKNCKIFKHLSVAKCIMMEYYAALK